MKYTEQYKMRRPEQKDGYDVDDFNYNFDIIDENMAKGVEDLQNHKDDNDNPHGVTAEQVGLGDVPNVTTNDQTPTYNEAAKLVGLISGENLSIAFGKIKKAIDTLISHVGDKNNPHNVTAEQVGLGDLSLSTQDEVNLLGFRSGIYKELYSEMPIHVSNSSDWIFDTANTKIGAAEGGAVLSAKIKNSDDIDISLFGKNVVFIPGSEHEIRMIADTKKVADYLNGYVSGQNFSACIRIDVRDFATTFVLVDPVEVNAAYNKKIFSDECYIYISIADYSCDFNRGTIIYPNFQPIEKNFFKETVLVEYMTQ